MPPHFHPIIVLIVLTYVLAAEIAKRSFYRSSRAPAALPNE